MESGVTNERVGCFNVIILLLLNLHLYLHLKVMKVKVKLMLDGGRCDFCMVNEPKHTINGGLWWICDSCMSREYVYYTPKEEEE